MKEKYVKTVTVYLTEEEYTAFTRACDATIYRKLSAYGRKLLLRKPITTIARNRSIDDFIELGVKLRKEMRLFLAKETLTSEEKVALFEKITQIEANLIKLVSQCPQA